MELEQLSKAVILNTDTGERIPVMFNPEQYSLEEGNNFAEIGIPGLQSPPIQYVRGKARTLSMELLFDTYERGEDVRAYSGRIVGLLAKLPQTSAPPVLLFTMGQLAFRCVLVDASQRFVMFKRDGTPVRAMVTVRFLEYEPLEIEVTSGLFVGPPTLHNVAQGQTLANLAADYLGDPTSWREIAEANDIDDPLHLVPGLSLVVPSRVK